MIKTKALMPSLREKKRYLAFEVMSDSRFEGVSREISKAADSFLGKKGMADAGIIILKERFTQQKGIIKVNSKHLDKLRATLCFVREIDGKKTIVRSLGASGSLRKAYEKYVA